MVVFALKIVAVWLLIDLVAVGLLLLFVRGGRAEHTAEDFDRPL